MIKKLIAVFLIVHPILISIIFTSYSIDFFWSIAKNYKIYGLIYAVISFSICLLGIFLITNKSKKFWLVYLTVIFVTYQVFSWSFKTRPYVSQLKLNQKYDLLLVPNDGGAFTATSSINLELIERKAMFFIKSKKIKTFNETRYGVLKFNNEQTIHIDLFSNSNKKSSQEIYLSSILNKEL